MFKKKLAVIVASILTIVSCCMLFSACERAHFTALQNTAFVSEELTLNTYGYNGEAKGTLTIGEKSYFVGYEDFTGVFDIYDLSNVPELQGSEALRWDWDVTGEYVEDPDGKYHTDYYLQLNSKYYGYVERMPVSPIWVGSYDENSFPFYKSTTYVKLEIERDFLSEREGTPSYAGKMIRLERQ